MRSILRMKTVVCVTSLQRSNYK